MTIWRVLLAESWAVPRVNSVIRDRGMGHVFAVRRLCLAAMVANAVCPAIYAHASDVMLRRLYAVNESANDRGYISIYDIDGGHRLIRTIQTVANVGDVRGVAGSAATGKLYVAYHNGSDAGMVYCLDIYSNVVLWNREVPGGIDRLSTDPNGQFIYAPTGEDRVANYIQVLNANTGDVIRPVYFSNRSHDSQYPLSGPLFQETKAEDGSGHYLYLIDPVTYAVSRVGPYAGILGPYAVDSSSRYVVNNVAGVSGMQVADLKTGQIITARFSDHPPGNRSPHGIGWTPDQTEAWETGGEGDPHIYVWDMLNPLTPLLKQRLTLQSGHRGHWVTFDIRGSYGYVSPESSDDGTEIFSVPTHASVGMIEASEEILEIDFANGQISRMGDQFGIGRR
jgi:outer membrane protein assembly factor BamB